MIMAGLEFYGDRLPSNKELDSKQISERIPFKDVYFTGIIRDQKGRKMSKSLGNSPDPLDLIAKYGADGLRYGIMSIAPQEQDIRFSEDRVEQGRNFCNKLWNACRFRQVSGKLEDNSSITSITDRIDAKHLDGDDYAILQKLLDTTEICDDLLTKYQFSQYTQAIYSFFWVISVTGMLKFQKLD